MAPWSITTQTDPIFNRPSLFYSQPAPIEAIGNSSQWLYIAGARLGIGGRVGAGYAWPADGIRARGFGLVYVIDTIAQGAAFSEPGEVCQGGTGIELENVRTLFLERCIVAGAQSSQPLHGSDPAGPAVSAPGATVALLFALLQGGGTAPTSSFGTLLVSHRALG